MLRRSNTLEAQIKDKQDILLSKIIDIKAHEPDFSIGINKFFGLYNSKKSFSHWRYVSFNALDGFSKRVLLENKNLSKLLSKKLQHLSPLWPSNIEKRWNLFDGDLLHEINILSSLYSRMFLNELYEQ